MKKILTDINNNIYLKEETIKYTKKNKKDHIIEIDRSPFALVDL